MNKIFGLVFLSLAINFSALAEYNDKTPTCSKPCRTTTGVPCCLYAKYSYDENCFENNAKPEPSCTNEVKAPEPEKIEKVLQGNSKSK